jgi:hypothetical protein
VIEHQIEIIGTVFFAIAILHTFIAPKILKLSHRFPKGSASEGMLHLLGEIEIVFGLWATVFMIVFAMMRGLATAIAYQDSLEFTEPIFVFCIMVMAATKPVMEVAKFGIQWTGNVVSKAFRLPAELADVLVILIVGPLMGSFITEPAAMTVTALLLNSLFKTNDRKLLYVLLAVLFVNISIGGALTHFAAPPILMVASKWNWDLVFVFSHLGWKSVLAVVLNALFVTVFFKKQIREFMRPLEKSISDVPRWVTIIHLVFLVFLILAAHHAALAVSIFLLFLGLNTATSKFQERLRMRESLLVAFFLGGIMMFGPLQAWWLAPLLKSLGSYALFLGACALTAVTDNAALTYLGSQVENLSDASKYFLVAGALAGGGLTIIANAPNAAGFSILQKRLGDGLDPWMLFKAALIPTAIAMLCLAIPS